MGGTSQKQVEANRRNAMRSTGPRTEEGKRRSRANGLRHGLAAEVVVPEGEAVAYEEARRRWRYEAGPDNVVEEHLIDRAAVASVRLDRIERANQRAREEAAREAVDRWEKRQQAAARRAGHRLLMDPTGVVEELEATAFGCDWLIRQWRALETPLRLGRGWGMEALQRAQALLGLPWVTPEVGAEPEVRRLWILAAVAEPSQIRAIGRIGVEADLPDLPGVAKSALRRFVARQVERLLALREESWAAVEGPRRDAIAALAASADTTPEGQLRHRYEASADRCCFASLRLFLNVRDRRRRELLAIAREAAEIGDTPKAPVGGGWWREADSDPTPPGFSRNAPPQPPAEVASAALASSPGAVAAGATVSTRPTPGADTGRSAVADPDQDRQPAMPAAPRPPIVAATAPGSPAVAPADGRSESPTAPRPSEPISATAPAAPSAPRPFPDQPLRPIPVDRIPCDTWRTDPAPHRDRPVRVRAVQGG